MGMLEGETEEPEDVVEEQGVEREELEEVR